MVVQKFLLEMIPESKLQSRFLQKITMVIQSINTAGVVVKTITCEGNRVNQVFFRMCKTISGKPWLTIIEISLLFGFVYLSKNIL